MVEHHNILLILGISAFVGILGAWAFTRLKFPQVVGYILIGLIVGQTGIGLIDAQHIKDLESFTFLALGIIGFLVGGELKISEMKKYGRQFTTILFGEGLLSFFLVFLATGTAIFFITDNLKISLAGAAVLGSIASATDPASTIDVLWENRSKGIVTTAIIAIIALDDVLAMSLYSFGKSFALTLIGQQSSLKHDFMMIAFELGGAVFLSLGISWLLKMILLRVTNKDKALAVSVCTLFLVIGLSFSLHMDVILSAMALGFGITNLLPKRSEELFHMARGMSIPVYVLFFVLVGARINLIGIPVTIWLIALVYVFCRAIGKIAGTYFGAGIARADSAVKKYCGIGLFAQGGVAIGLAIVAGKSLNDVPFIENLSLGEAVISIVTVTTVIVQLIGPPLVRLAVRLAGENGRNITEEDVVADMIVRDVITIDETPFRLQDNVESIINNFSESDLTIKTVIDQNNEIRGIINFDSLKDLLSDRDSWLWLLASDIMNVNFEAVKCEEPLQKVLFLMNSTNQDVLVVKDDCSNVIGFVKIDSIKKIVRKRLLAKVS